MSASSPDRPRYAGSLIDQHGEVILADDCMERCCWGVEPWDQPHATLWVRRDSDGRTVKLLTVRFASFTGRP